MLAHPPLDRVTAILNELSKAEVFELGLFGGEFFFYPSWREVMAYAHRLGFFMSFVSNGTLIDTETTNLMKKYGIHCGAISIHGPAEVHDRLTGVEGTHSKATRGLGNCLDAGIRTSVLTTITRENFGLLHQTVDELRTLGLVSDGMSYVVGRLCPAGRGADEWRRDRLTLGEYISVLKELEKIHDDFGITAVMGDAFPLCLVPKRYRHLIEGCWMSTGFGHIGHSGTVKGCGIAQHSFGNLLQTPLKEIWQSPEMQRFRELHWLPGKCLSCSTFCGGGCVASRISPVGYAPDEFLDI